MGLIQDMAKQRASQKLPKPTTAGDDTVIAAKTGEYVLPPEVVAMIGVDKLDAMVAQMTGQQPGGEPAMMGHAKGGCVKGYASGGLISQIEKGLSRNMKVGASLLPAAQAKRPEDPFDDIRGVIPDAFPVAQAGQPEPLQPQGIAPNDDPRPVYGFAEGGLVDDLLQRRLAQATAGAPMGDVRAAMSSATPQGTRLNTPMERRLAQATSGGAPNPGLREAVLSAEPQPTRLQGMEAPKPLKTVAPAEAPRGTPSRTVAELDARAAGKRVGPAPSVGERVAGAKQGYSQAQGARVAAEAATPKPGLAARAKAIPGMIARTTAAAAPLAGFGDYRIDDPGVDSSAGGVISNLASGEGGKAWAGLKQGAVEAGLDSVSGLAKTADSLAGLVGAQPGLAQAFDDRVQADIGPMLKREAPQVASAIPQARAAEPKPQGPSMEQSLGKFIADERGTPATPAPAAPKSAPKSGPISGLAARAQQQPATPRVDQSALQAQIDASPIAVVQSGPVGPNGAAGHLINYKDGRSEFVQKLPEDAKAWYALTAQGDASGPVEVIKGSQRFIASPESGYQPVPKFVADAGMTGQYVQSAGQGWVDAVDPTGAAMRLDGAKTDNAIRQSNATDRDGEGRGLRNKLAKLEYDLKVRALAGDQAAIQQLNMLRGAGSQDDYSATTREVPIDPTNPLSGTIKEPVIYNKRTGQIMGGGTVQTNSSAPAGMRQVGTSGGKPVYQDAQGNRFIGD